MIAMLILSFVGIGLAGLWVGFRVGARYGYEEGVSVGRKSERRFANQKKEESL
jgi:hypothetical protein